MRNTHQTVHNFCEFVERGNPSVLVCRFRFCFHALIITQRMGKGMSKRDSFRPANLETARKVIECINRKNQLHNESLKKGKTLR